MMTKTKFKATSYRNEVGILFRAGSPDTEQVKPADGHQFTLDELRGFIGGGWLEGMPDNYKKQAGVKQGERVYFDEEGQLKHLYLATNTFQLFLVGDVIQIVKENQQP
jgi:hypothetical protein